jgi:uncharacterized protein YoxC
VTWYISGAIVLVGLLVLVVAVSILLGRMKKLNRVQRSLQVRLDQAKTLQEPVLALQKRAEEMQETMLQVQEQLEVRAARKAAAEAS